MQIGSGCFNGCNSIIYCNKSSLNEYKWEIPSPQQLSLYRKLSDVIYDVETTLTSSHCNEEEDNDLSVQDVTDTIRNGSATIREYISEYIEFLFDEKQKLEYQLTKAHIKRHQITKQEFKSLSDSLKHLNSKIEILINSEYVWKVAEIFWIDATENHDSILITLKFLDVMHKFRSPLNSLQSGNVEFDSDNYWNLLYKNAIYGKLDVIRNEINNFTTDKISTYSKRLMDDLCRECPLFNCLNIAEDATEDEVTIPSKEDILKWKSEVKRVMNQITEKRRLLPLLRIFCGEMEVISRYVDEWLDWISAYLLFKTPWIDHKNELRSLLTLKANFDGSQQGSIEWMFGCIMSNEYSSILYYVDKIFPPWFAPHLCYFLRRSHPNLVIQWPRQKEIESDYNAQYNDYIMAHPKMTVCEWIFEGYVEDLLFASSDAWLWLKNYLYFFKRRGLSMLTAIFEGIEITSDKMAYLMLQTVNEFNLNDSVYNMICLRMAHASYLHHMQYGRITYWCCKCKHDGKESSSSIQTFTMYLAHLIRNYLNTPTKYINVLHDVCDNANIDECDAKNDLKGNTYLRLLSKLRDMYLCRYDLQKGDLQFIKGRENKTNHKQKQQRPQIKPPKPTPFTTSRGHLIDALSKPYNAHNRNLKNMADSFDIADDDDDVDMIEDRSPLQQEEDHKAAGDEDDDDVIKYPNLIKRNHSASPSESDTSFNAGPFPKSVMVRNKKMEERASTDFLLNNLITPPRPTPSRSKKHSHRKSSHKKKSIQKVQMKRTEVIDMDMDTGGTGIQEEEEAEEDKHYMMECCDIIVSYVNYLVEILSSEIYDVSHVVPILMFSLPILSHKYAPNAITMNNILIVSHKWCKIKFIKNQKKTGIHKFNTANEIKLINEILAHLQSKVLATTYSNKNYAQIWKREEDALHKHNIMNIDHRNDDKEAQQEVKHVQNDKEEEDEDEDSDQVIYNID